MLPRPYLLFRSSSPFVNQYLSIAAVKSKESKKEGEAEGGYRQHDAEQEQPCEAASEVPDMAVFPVECLTPLLRVAETAEQLGQEEHTQSHD